MPRWLSSAPRKKFPPPVTIATWVPPATTSAISTASECATSGSTPIRPPPKTSPDSFSRTRRYQPPDPAPDDDGGAASLSVIGSPSVVEQWSVKPYLLRGADLEVDEAGHGHAGGVQHLLHALLLLLHRLLLEQDDALEEAVEATLDDLRQRRLGLALGPGGLLGHPALGLHDLGRDVLAGQVLRPH